VSQIITITASFMAVDADVDVMKRDETRVLMTSIMLDLHWHSAKSCSCELLMHTKLTSHCINPWRL